MIVRMASVIIFGSYVFYAKTLFNLGMMKMCDGVNRKEKIFKRHSINRKHNLSKILGWHILILSIIHGLCNIKKDTFSLRVIAFVVI